MPFTYRKSLLTVLLIGYSTASFTQDEIKQWILESTKRYSPASYELLTRYKNMSDTFRIVHRANNNYTYSSTITLNRGIDRNPLKYVELESRKTALESMETNIHEISHSYSNTIFYESLQSPVSESEYDFANIHQGFYHTPDPPFAFQIERAYIFPSKELTAYIPKEMITFRYKTYINGNTSTQSDGVIGLLEEMNAYYLGSKFNFEMLPVYKQLYPDDYLNAWVKKTMSIMTAYYEFDFFIKEYLRYAKSYRPDTYTYLKKNQPFKNAYRLIQHNFKLLTEQYERIAVLERTKLPFLYESFFWKADYDRLLPRLYSGAYSAIESDFLH